MAATGRAGRQTSEHEVEEHLRLQCRKRGFLCLKFTSPSRSGVPDRVIITPRQTLFVEVKKPGEKPRRLQIETISRMQAAGAVVHVVDSFAAVDELIAELTGPGLLTGSEGSIPSTSP